MSTPSGAKGARGVEKGAENQLSALLGNVNNATSPVMGELGRQIYEALSTGGVGAQIPIIGAAQSQSRQATSRALQGDTDQLAQMGLSRSPFAASTLAGTRLAGESATSLIPSEIASRFISLAPSFGFGGLNAQTAGLGALGGFGANRDIAKGRDTADLWGKAIGAIGQIGGAGVGAL